MQRGTKEKDQVRWVGYFFSELLNSESVINLFPNRAAIPNLLKNNNLGRKDANESREESDGITKDRRLA